MARLTLDSMSIEELAALRDRAIESSPRRSCRSRPSSRPK